MITERNETSSDSDLKQPLHCIMEQQKAEREAMALQQQELLTRMLEMVQTRSEAKTELSAQTVEETLSVSMKDPIIQSNGINDKIRKCMMEPQKSEREAMTQKEFWTKMQEIVQLGLKATTEINAVNCAETPSVSMKDLIMQSTGTNVEIPEMAFYQDFINIANPIEKAASSKPGLTLDALSGYAENDQTYTQYKKLKDLEGINVIKIPGHESFTFDKMDFESEDQIYCDTKVIVEHYRKFNEK
uniref:Uncharacterized protein n=1 Tax=Acrobeloides nanus TaxID=290746 RepID=A0A914CNM2_9BILA